MLIIKILDINCLIKHFNWCHFGVSVTYDTK